MAHAYKTQHHRYTCQPIRSCRKAVIRTPTRLFKRDSCSTHLPDPINAPSILQSFHLTRGGMQAPPGILATPYVRMRVRATIFQADCAECTLAGSLCTGQSEAAIKVDKGGLAAGAVPREHPFDDEIPDGGDLIVEFLPQPLLKRMHLLGVLRRLHGLTDAVSGCQVCTVSLSRRVQGDLLHEVNGLMIRSTLSQTPIPTPFIRRYCCCNINAAVMHLHDFK